MLTRRRLNTCENLKCFEGGDSTILELVIGVHGRSQDGFAVECRVKDDTSYYIDLRNS